MSRRPTHRYEDPLDAIWLACAGELGLTVVRSDEVYASFDGDKTLRLCTAAAFDADDSLAQLILHELCHGLVAGDARAKHADWGLENTDERDQVMEHACHRVQAALADQYGLRAFFAVTTDWRPYWDAMPIDTLRTTLCTTTLVTTTLVTTTHAGADPAIPIARAAFERARSGPWASALRKALEATAALAAVVRATQPASDSLWSLTRGMHRSGFPLARLDRDAASSASCGTCAWSFQAKGALRCRQTPASETTQHVAVKADDPACVRHDPRLSEVDCAECGACCREGFDRVEVRARDLVRRKHAELVSTDAFGEFLARPGGLCVALEQEKTVGYRCRIYAQRPRACAEFEIGGDACLTARRRVGRSA